MVAVAQSRHRDDERDQCRGCGGPRKPGWRWPPVRLGTAPASATAAVRADNPASLFTRTQRKRIDYILPSATSGLQTTTCEVPDQRDLGNSAVSVTVGTTDDRGVRPSDHNMLSAICSRRGAYTRPDPAGTTTRELVMYAADSLVRVGAWAVVADAEAAGGTRLVNSD